MKFTETGTNNIEKLINGRSFGKLQISSADPDSTFAKKNSWFIQDGGDFSDSNINIKDGDIVFKYTDTNKNWKDWVVIRTGVAILEFSNFTSKVDKAVNWL